MKKQRIKDDPNRRQKLALLLAWRTFRRSIARGKPMTLPNLLRLYRRCCADVCPKVTDDAPLIWLRKRYLAQQPFCGSSASGLLLPLPRTGRGRQGFHPGG